MNMFRHWGAGLSGRRPNAAVTTVFLAMLQANLPTPFYAIWQQDLEMSNAAITWVWAAYILAVLVTLLIVRVMGTRVGRRAPMLVGLALGLVGMGALVFVDSAELIIFARVCCGVTTGMVSTVGVALAVESGAPSARLRTSQDASLAIGAAAAIGPLISGLGLQTLAEAQSAVFGIGFIALAASAVLTMRGPRGHAPDRRRRSKVTASRPPNEYRSAMAVANLSFAVGFALSAYLMSLGPTLMLVQLGVTANFIVGAAMFAQGVSNVLAQLALRGLSSRWKIAYGCISLIICAVLLVGAIMLSSVLVLILAIFMVGAGQSLTQAGAFEITNLAVSDAWRASAQSRLSINGYLAAGVAPLGLGYLSDVVGLSSGAWIATIVLGIAALVALGAGLRLKRYPAT